MTIMKETKPGEYEGIETKIKYFGEIELFDVIGNFFERTDVHEDGTLSKYYGIEIDDEDSFYAVVRENHKHTWEQIGTYTFECGCGKRVDLHALLTNNEELEADMNELTRRIKKLGPWC